MITRLKSINRYIKYILMTVKHDEDRSGDWLRGTTPFIEKELVAILIRMIPRKWSMQILNANLRPYSMNLERLKEYLPGLQKSEAHEYQRRTPKGGEKGNDTERKDGKRKNQKGKRGRSDNRSEKFYAH